MQFRTDLYICGIPNQIGKHYIYKRAHVQKSRPAGVVFVRQQKICMLYFLKIFRHETFTPKEYRAIAFDGFSTEWIREKKVSVRQLEQLGNPDKVVLPSRYLKTQAYTNCEQCYQIFRTFRIDRPKFRPNFFGIIYPKFEKIYQII